MIRVNLTQRIWLSFISLIVLVGLSIVLIYPISIKGTLTEETYRIIEQEQARFANPYSDYFNPPTSELDFIERREAERSVGHLFLLNQYGTLRGDPVPNEVVQEMGENAFKQQTRRGRYELTYGGATLFYVISKVQTSNEEAYQISYMWDTYRDQMVNRMWERLVYIMIVTSALSLIPALWLKGYLRQPLIILGNHFEQISKRNWQEPFKWKGDEDFQKLSDQFEMMRQNLMRYDRAQKTFIQHASHELKTPIMIIKSYAQSVKDGILPKENIEQTMDVIMEEAQRMERRVKDMIYFTKLDSLSEVKPKVDEVIFGSVAFQLEERFRVQREDVTFMIEGADVRFWGDSEQIQVLLENFIENALRYAKDKIWIRAIVEDDEVILTVENNGEKIDEEDMSVLFVPFHKGNKGQFGLGLAIVKRIAELHFGTPYVENTDRGVSFGVKMPVDVRKNT
ncbi:sensor histidine kinase [Bacillus sp. FJAT-45350]|uniref:sensor histidine kinase n=1 Tax=Bacillus sp. FJAT-45350 TaxID=2011014 RepID=UPI000BB927E1|nr:HAMP domain-containing sensor histidine kinase [Bacillus sp. FJAT-45350]